eukprot:g10980.t1
MFYLFQSTSFPSPTKECRDVSERLATAKKMLKVAKMKLQAIPTWKGDYITGKSNHQWRCKCVCGELENEKTMECKRNREGWSTCPDSRPCCTNLDDCKAEDPWPKKVEEQYEKKTAKPKVMNLGICRVSLQSGAIKPATIFSGTGQRGQAICDVFGTNDRGLPHELPS